jgi:hypothetical protein
MDRKVWANIVQYAIDRYRRHVAGEGDFPDDDGYWTPKHRAEATVEDHITEAFQCLAGIGRERLG